MKAKLHYVFSIAMFLSIFSVIAQNPSWKKIESAQDAKSISKLDLDKVHVFELNMASFKESLITATVKNDKSKKQSTIITIPSEDGKLESFKIYETSVFAPDLAALYPEIKSYVGISTDNSGTRLRLSVSPQGVQTMITYLDKPDVFMQPTTNGSAEYILYNRNSKSSKTNRFSCKTIDDINENPNKNGSTSKTSLNEGGANDKTLQKYRIAISVTGEYTVYHGGTVAGALAAINATLNRVNEIFETDMAITFQLVNAQQLIYTNASTDPYSPATTGVDGAWSTELQNTLTSVIGEGAYDIGHLFGATGGGGNAGCIGCVCVNGSKGSGYTSPSNGIPQGDTFDIDFVIHEIGHQMGANHTFAFENEGTGVNSEPGSGTTIMAYAGLEGSNNVELNSDTYFHYQSIKQILTNVSTKSCKTTEVIANNPPSANAGNDYYIPAGTAYVLKGSATDSDGGDALSYCWEQIDSGLVNYLNFGPGLTTGSTNRSLPPTSVSNRYIPNFSSVLAGKTTQTNPSLGSDWETVSTVSRNLNWALTVRDRTPASSTGAQSSYDTMKITVEAVTPFTISNPVSWAQGSNVTINWVVGQTTNATINCQNVTIKLSTDSGLTFPTTIASNTANDGSFTYSVPSIPNTSTARLLIEASNNIFYDVSNFDFSISPEQDFFMVDETLDPIACGETTATYHFNYVASNGFSEITTFSATGNPGGSTVAFTPSSLSASGSVTMTISNLSGAAQATYPITITGTATTKTKTKVVNFPFYNGNCPSIANTDYATSTTGVTFNTINNLNTGKPSGYSNYTGISTNVNRNSSYNLTVRVNTDGDWTTSTKVWIDWNQNCSFNDAGEEYNLGDATNVSNGTTSNSGLSITVPAAATSGNTIMRVSTKYKDDGLPVSCENGFDGEVEDYTLNIISQPVSISLVKFNTINNISSISSGYNDFKSISTTVNRNNTYPLSVNIITNGNFESSTKAWIDWNQNSIFEDSEELYNLGNTTNVSNGATTNSPFSISIPLDAILGNTIMRVSTKDGDGSMHTSDGNIIDGEVEDYTINIIPTESIEEFGFENFIVFPNPNNGTFEIQLNGSLERAINVSIFDVRGRYIYNNMYPNVGDFRQEIQLNNAQSGMYILNVSDGLRRSIKKIVIK